MYAPCATGPQPTSFGYVLLDLSSLVGSYPPSSWWSRPTTVPDCHELKVEDSLPQLNQNVAKHVATIGCSPIAHVITQDFQEVRADLS